MRKLLAPALLLAAFLWPAFANAADVKLTWTAPTTCSDGTPIANCPVTGYRIETAPSATATTWTFVATTANLTYTHTGVAPGPHCYRAAANSAAGLGAWSQVLTGSCSTVVAPTPGAPGSVVATDIVAYERRADGTMRVVGVVPMGTLCSPETLTAGTLTYRRVDANTVDTFVQPALPRVFWARCS